MLLVPVKNIEVLDKIQPETDLFPLVLKQNPIVSIHPFTNLDITRKEFYARHSSSPYSKTKEDPVTGTASGVMEAYALAYIYSEDDIILQVHQGKHVQKDGLVQVFAKSNVSNIDIQIVGQATYSKETLIFI